MKRIISLVITAVLLCSVMLLSAAPALADYDPHTVLVIPDSKEITGEHKYNNIAMVIENDTIVKKDANVEYGVKLEIAEDITMTVEPGACVSVSKVLKIKSGGTLVIGGTFTGDLNSIDNAGTVTLLPGAYVDVSFTSLTYARAFADDLKDYGAKTERINNREQQLVTYRVTCSVPPDKAFLNSTISGGNVTLIVGVACLAAGFLAGMLVFRKKPAPKAQIETQNETETE